MIVVDLTASGLVSEAVLGASKVAWQAEIEGEIVMVAGVAQESLLGWAELWFTTGPAFNKHRFKAMRAFRELLLWVLTQFPRVYARVEPGAEKLVEFVGMRFVAWDEWPDGRRWKRYEA